MEGAGIAASGGFAAIGIAIGMSVWRAREAKSITTYGSARWATHGGNPRRWAPRAGWCRAWPLRTRLSPARRARTRSLLRPDPVRKGRRARHPDALDLARFGHRPRHQGRELAAHRRLARTVRPRAAVRSDQSAVGCLQSVARSAPRRHRGARRPERRRHPGRSRGCARAAKSLGEDQPFAPGRRDPACPLRRARQDARRRRQFPVRSRSGRSRPRSAP